MTSAPSRPTDCGQTELPLTLSAAASPVRTSALPERALGWRVNVLAYGASMPASFASYDPASSSWKTSQRSLVEDLETFSETWPRSGIMRGGTASQLQPLAPITVAIGSGLLPTPEASNTKATAMRSGGRSPRDFTKPLWPTPTLTYTRADWSAEEVAARQAEVRAQTLAKGKHYTGNGFGLNFGAGGAVLADAAGERQPEARRLRRHEPAERSAGGGQVVGDAGGQGQAHDQGRGQAEGFAWFRAADRAGWLSRADHFWSSEPDVGRVAHGVPARVDRLHGLGNAVVPEIPYRLGRAILTAESQDVAA
jgi:hypothetical protein